MFTPPEKICLCPVVGEKAYHDDAIVSASVEDGWYWLDIFTGKVQKKATFVDLLGYSGRKVYCFADGQVVMPAQLDNFKRLTGKTAIDLTEIYLSSPPVYETLRIAYIREKFFYLDKAPAPPSLVIMKNKIDKGEQPVRIKTMSPEMVYFISCYHLVVAEAQAKLRVKTVEERLKHLLEAGGGKLVSWKKAGQKYISVVWEIMSERFKTTVYAENFGIFNLGICVSGGDKELHLENAPHVVKNAIEESGVYRTQRTE